MTGTWGQVARDWAPIVVAMAALGFTTFSFWWMHWRVGPLTVAMPSTYAATTQANKLILLLPLVFYNAGPVPHVVRDLRLRFADEPSGNQLDFQRIRSGVSPSHSELIDLASPFPVPGNEAVRLFCEFQRSPVGRAMDVKSHPLQLEALSDKRDGWHTLLTFGLNVDSKSATVMPTNFVAFSNRLESTGRDSEPLPGA